MVKRKQERDENMENFKVVHAATDSAVGEIASLAEVIWHEHFTPIIGEAQVRYMVDKFQSFPALKEQIAGGYEYFQIFNNDIFSGYIGIHEENNELFLSKLYLAKESRGQHLATKAFDFLKNLCRERGLEKIWLTCNKYNTHTLDVYHHLGLSTTRTQVADIGEGYVMDDYILEYEI